VALPVSGVFFFFFYLIAGNSVNFREKRENKLERTYKMTDNLGGVCKDASWDVCYVVDREKLPR